MQVDSEHKSCCRVVETSSRFLRLLDAAFFLNGFYDSDCRHGPCGGRGSDAESEFLSGHYRPHALLTQGGDGLRGLLALGKSRGLRAITDVKVALEGYDLYCTVAAGHLKIGECAEIGGHSDDACARRHVVGGFQFGASVLDCRRVALEFDQGIGEDRDRKRVGYGK